MRLSSQEAWQTAVSACVCVAVIVITVAVDHVPCCPLPLFPRLLPAGMTNVLRLRESTAAQISFDIKHFATEFSLEFSYTNTQTVSGAGKTLTLCRVCHKFSLSTEQKLFAFERTSR